MSHVDTHNGSVLIPLGISLDTLNSRHWFYFRGSVRDEYVALGYTSLFSSSLDLVFIPVTFRYTLLVPSSLDLGMTYVTFGHTLLFSPAQ